MALRLVIVFFAICLGSSIAQAQQAGKLDPDTYIQAIQIFDIAVFLPPPSWQETVNPFSESEFFRNANSNQFVFEQIPKGQKFESWEQMLAVFGIHLRGLPLQRFVDGSVATFANACSKETFSVSKISEQPDNLVILILCGNSAAGPKQDGYGEGVGEVTLMSFGQLRDTTVKVYHHWRGKHFDNSRRDTWPVDDPTLAEMKRRFTKIRYLPAEQ